MNIEEETEIIIELRRNIEVIKDQKDKNILLNTIKKMNSLILELDNIDSTKDRNFYKICAMIIKEKALNGVNNVTK